MRRLWRLLLPLVAASATLLASAAPAQATPAKVNGTGSSYVALAMNQWTNDGNRQGLPVNYLPTNSVNGLTSFQNRTVDFGATEAEFSALGLSDGIDRGYQYVPDVAGAIAIMYNVDDPSGRPSTTLHLSRATIAKIFMGLISSWDDPAITADNKGYPLPAQPITVVFRTGNSGTTALYYDFVQNTLPGEFGAWAAKNGLPTDHRIITLDNAPGFAPHILGQPGSDQIASTVRNTKWTIAYDEFGYAVTYKVPAAWVQNQSGTFVQPYAQNIASALKSANLRPDLSQDLRGVYTSPEADAYPISAYSYLVTQCAPDGARPTCKGPYPNAGTTETLQKWMRYIACEGQVKMAEIGYSPLPPNLSNEVAKSIARMDGSSPETLTAANCPNPTFSGSLGGPAPPVDPLKDKARGSGSGGTGGASGAGNGSGGSNGAGAGATDDAGAGSTDAAATGDEVAADSAAASEDAAGAGGAGAGAVRGARRTIAPLAYERGGSFGGGFPLPLIVLLSVVLVPPLISALKTRRRT